MSSVKNWMLGAAIAAGIFGLGTGKAQAAEFGIYARGPVAYEPQCPGPGYIWITGYRDHGYWVPGRWSFAGYRGGYGHGYSYYDRGHRDSDWHHDHYDHGHDRNHW